MCSKCVGKWGFAAHGAAHFEYLIKGIFQKTEQVMTS